MLYERACMYLFVLQPAFTSINSRFRFFLSESPVSSLPCVEIQTYGEDESLKSSCQFNQGSWNTRWILLDIESGGKETILNHCGEILGRFVDVFFQQKDEVMMYKWYFLDIVASTILFHLYTMFTVLLFFTV